LQGSNAGKDEIQQDKGEWIKRAIVIEIHPQGKKAKRCKYKWPGAHGVSQHIRRSLAKT
jgi:hypothetical protein